MEFGKSEGLLLVLVLLTGANTLCLLAFCTTKLSRFPRASPAERPPTPPNFGLEAFLNSSSGLACLSRVVNESALHFEGQL